MLAYQNVSKYKRFSKRYQVQPPQEENGARSRNDERYSVEFRPKTSPRRRKCFVPT